MFAVALSPGLLVGTIAAGTLELTGGVKIVAVIVGAFAAVATIVGIIYGAKWKTAHAVEKALSEGLTRTLTLTVQERDDARVKLEDATSVLIEARSTIARLEALPNLERVLELIGSTFGRLAARLEELHREHDQAAKDRQAEVLAEIHKAA